MAYVGQGIKGGTFSVLDTSGNTYNGSNVTFNLGTQVSSPAQLLVSHDGVIQKPVSDYTLATGGTQITFTTAPASGASIFITEISGAVGAPMNRDINGDELILDADGDTSITADTDDQIDIRVSGTDQITIKDGALSPVTDNDIDLGTSSLEFKDAYFDGTLHCDVLDLAGTEHTSLSSGLGSADQWRINSNFSGDATPLASNWERVDTDGFGQLGSGMTESSGVFTFPSTGIWLVIVQIEHEFANADSFTQFDLKTCTDGSTFGSASMASLGGRNDDHKSGFINHVLDVTNTSNVKCRLDLAGAHSSNVSLGDTNETNTGITFLKLGDT